MKIVFLNSELQFSDNQIKRLKKLGQILFVTRANLAKKEAIKYLKDADIAAITPSSIKSFNREIINSCPKLKGIALNTTGWDFVDLKAACERDIPVSNIPHYASQSVAEHTFALIFAVAKHIVAADKSVRAANSDFKPFLGWELKEKTLGIIGLGSIGSLVAEIGLALGMKVLAYNPSAKKKKGVENVSFENVFGKSDVVSIHCPLNKETENLIGEKELNLMKPAAILINTAREAIVNKNALIKALKNKKIAGYGVDLAIMRTDLNKEPLFQFENVVATPHNAFYTKEAIEREIEMWIDNIKAHVRGKQKNVVNM